MFYEGAIVKLSEEARENDTYERFRDHKFRVTEWFDHYSVNLNDAHGHPGYDSHTSERLYDLFDMTTGQECPCSLYDYELVRSSKFKVVAYCWSGLDSTKMYTTYYHLKCWRQNLSKCISRKFLGDVNEWPVGAKCSNCGETL